MCNHRRSEACYRFGFSIPVAKARSDLSNTSMLMALRRMNLSDLTMHGFRSTFRDCAAESNSNLAKSACKPSCTIDRIRQRLPTSEPI